MSSHTQNTQAHADTDTSTWKSVVKRPASTVAALETACHWEAGSIQIDYPVYIPTENEMPEGQVVESC